MPITDQEMKQLAADVQLGQLYGMSPTLKDVGNKMVDRADKKLILEQKNKNDLQRAADARADADTTWEKRLGITNAQYNNRQDDKDTEWERRQGIKDAAALKRAQTTAGKVSPSTREKRRQSRMALEGTQHLLELVDSNPDAFGPMSDLTQYMGDYWPAFATEGVKNIQQNLRSEKDTATRATLFAQATERVHDLAGAAQSVSEAARIARFVPDSNDSATVIRGKLKSAVDEAKRQNSSYDQEYGGGQQQPTAAAGLNDEAGGLKPVGKPFDQNGMVIQEMEDANGNRDFYEVQ